MSYSSDMDITVVVLLAVLVGSARPSTTISPNMTSTTQSPSAFTQPERDIINAVISHYRSNGQCYAGSYTCPDISTATIKNYITTDVDLRVIPTMFTLTTNYTSLYAYVTDSVHRLNDDVVALSSKVDYFISSMDQVLDQIRSDSASVTQPVEVDMAKTILSSKGIGDSELTLLANVFDFPIKHNTTKRRRKRQAQTSTPSANEPSNNSNVTVPENQKWNYITNHLVTPADRETIFVVSEVFKLIGLIILGIIMFPVIIERLIGLYKYMRRIPQRIKELRPKRDAMLDETMKMVKPGTAWIGGTDWRLGTYEQISAIRANNDAVEIVVTYEVSSYKTCRKARGYRHDNGLPDTYQALVGVLYWDKESYASNLSKVPDVFDTNKEPICSALAYIPEGTPEILTTMTSEVMSCLKIDQVMSSIFSALDFTTADPPSMSDFSLLLLTPGIFSDTNIADVAAGTPLMVTLFAKDMVVKTVPTIEGRTKYPASVTLRCMYEARRPTDHDMTTCNCQICQQTRLMMITLTILDYNMRLGLGTNDDLSYTGAQNIAEALRMQSRPQGTSQAIIDLQPFLRDMNEDEIKVACTIATDSHCKRKLLGNAKSAPVVMTAESSV